MSEPRPEIPLVDKLLGIAALVFATSVIIATIYRWVSEPCP